MSVEYETIIKVPENFIGKILEGYFNYNIIMSARLKDNQFSFNSKNPDYPGVDKIVELSRNFPNIIFETITICDMNIEVAEILKINNGEIIDKRKEIWFNFQYEKNKKDKLTPEEKQEFEDKAREYFNIENNLVYKNYGMNGGLDEDQFSSDRFFQQVNGVFSQTKRIKWNTLDVTLNFLKERENSNDIESLEKYDPLPFKIVVNKIIRL